MLQSVRDDHYHGNPIFNVRQAALLEYCARLCRHPETMCEQDLDNLRAAGISDAEILEAVQASACFAYWVRFINALGVQLGNETIGLYGNDDS